MFSKKWILAFGALLLGTQLAHAQSYPGRQGYRAPSTPCTCVQTREITGQPDGTSSVCQFSAFGAGQGGKPWFDGGWYLTGDLVSFDCKGGIAGSGRITYGNAPSPLCQVTSRVEVPTNPLRCVHQADTNHDHSRSAAENQAWSDLHKPVETGAYAGKASQAAIDLFNLTFSLAVNGSDLCDPSRTPSEVSACRAKPFECRRLDFVKAVDPTHAQQIQAAFSGFPNSLDHCSLE